LTAETEFIGVTADSRHDVASGGTGLYEFWTSTGVPVRLHDTVLTSIELRPIDRTLILRFEYEDSAWMPPEAVQTPVIVMEFDDVTILEWLQAADDGEEPPAEAFGQVADFGHFNRNTFQLTTYLSDIQFTAARATVTLQRRE